MQDELRQLRESQNYDVRYMLCPVALDQRWKTAPWSEETLQEIMDHNIRDFSGWMDDPGFKRMFGEFLDSLELPYQRQDAIPERGQPVFRGGPHQHIRPKPPTFPASIYR